MHKVPAYLLVVLFVGISLILFGVVFGTYGVDVWVLEKKDVASFLKELGFACIIGFLISVIIERAAREEEIRIFDTFVKESGSNVLKAVYGQNISQELFEDAWRGERSTDDQRSARPAKGIAIGQPH